MAATLHFYFDFASPYGYFAAHEIEALAARHARDVEWHPVLLGALWKSTGITPLVKVPRKGEYARHDWDRIARLTGVEYHEPAAFPIATQAAARAFIAARRVDRVGAVKLALALYRAYFAQGRDISVADTVLDVCADQGWDRATMAASITDPAIKDALKDEVALADGHGVFGSPFVIVDGEPFWGWDRLPMVERWLARGGF